jgi:hypothetical protein
MLQTSSVLTSVDSSLISLALCLGSAGSLDTGDFQLIQVGFGYRGSMLASKSQIVALGEFGNSSLLLRF